MCSSWKVKIHPERPKDCGCGYHTISPSDNFDGIRNVWEEVFAFPRQLLSSDGSNLRLGRAAWAWVLQARPIYREGSSLRFNPKISSSGSAWAWKLEARPITTIELLEGCVWVERPEIWGLLAPFIMLSPKHEEVQDVFRKRRRGRKCDWDALHTLPATGLH